MPLVPAVLQMRLSAFLDPSYAGFTGSPTSEVAAAAAWAGAFRAYMESLAIPPPVNPMRHVLAEKAMQGALAGMSVPGQGLVALQRGFVAYAGVIALNSSPIAVPPPPLVLSVFPPTPSATAVVSSIVSTIAAWIITGTFTIPPAPPVPWG